MVTELPQRGKNTERDCLSDEFDLSCAFRHSAFERLTRLMEAGLKMFPHADNLLPRALSTALLFFMNSLHPDMKSRSSSRAWSFALLLLVFVPTGSRAFAQSAPSVA